MADGRTRRPRGKKGPTKGSGGKGKRRLQGRGPTPKAEDRVYHKAYKAKREAEERAQREAARKAARVPKLRSILHLQEDHELICGRNSVLEAVRAGIPLARVFLAASMTGDKRLTEVAQKATAFGAPLIEVSRTELDRMAGNENHQGVAIEVPPYTYANLEDLADKADDRASARDEAPLFIALDSITDPHNLGAIMRSAAAFGADGVIIPERRAAGVTATVWKVSAGAAAFMPVARVTNLVQALTTLKSRGYFVVGLDGGGEVSIENLHLADAPLVLVTGSEGRGLARLTRDTCDQIASIPISERMESLNASVATGIALFEVERVRRARRAET
ncbi:tRNA/rRNA methyltransferase [Actinobaculum suis]|uniref:tRNA/rRNA methyltransferase n=1 Tax=Actinobaculum suis TaxID=1657 RepID=A0A7Z9C7S7_9ACTO|nr:23S rRNA (guanosine(2251)-2'-O)-methyltransferase RlmB [Actinobaculum suis]VDG75684.1 tRNA/rRNA methyltransferase [Actinobaculum suis]